MLQNEGEHPDHLSESHPSNTRPSDTLPTNLAQIPPPQVLQDPPVSAEGSFNALSPPVIQGPVLDDSQVGVPDGSPTNTTEPTPMANLTTRSNLQPTSSGGVENDLPASDEAMFDVNAALKRCRRYALKKKQQCGVFH